jgi:hypothetical protein
MAKSLPLILAAGAAVLLLGGKKKSSSSSKTASLPPLPKEFASPESFPKTTGPSDSSATPETWMLRQKTLAFLASQGVCGCDPGAIDGSYGASTKNAIIAFQKCSGLSPDGKWGAKTEAAAKEALSRIANRVKSPPSSSTVPKPAPDPVPANLPEDYRLNPSEWAMAAPLLASFGYNVTQDPLSHQSISEIDRYLRDYNTSRFYVSNWMYGTDRPWVKQSKNSIIDSLLFIKQELVPRVWPTWQRVVSESKAAFAVRDAFLNNLGYATAYSGLAAEHAVRVESKLFPKHNWKLGPFTGDMGWYYYPGSFELGPSGFRDDWYKVSRFLKKYYAINLPIRRDWQKPWMWEDWDAGRNPASVADAEYGHASLDGYFMVFPSGGIYDGTMLLELIYIHRNLVPKYWNSWAELVWMADKFR